MNQKGSKLLGKSRWNKQKNYINIDHWCKMRLSTNVVDQYQITEENTNKEIASRYKAYYKNIFKLYNILSYPLIS